MRRHKNASSHKLQSDTNNRFVVIRKPLLSHCLSESFSAYTNEEWCHLPLTSSLLVPPAARRGRRLAMQMLSSCRTWVARGLTQYCWEYSDDRLYRFISVADHCTTQPSRWTTYDITRTDAESSMDYVFRSIGEAACLLGYIYINYNCRIRQCRWAVVVCRCSVSVPLIKTRREYNNDR